jgi:hypothetical protein
MMYRDYLFLYHKVYFVRGKNCTLRVGMREERREGVERGGGVG